MYVVKLIFLSLASPEEAIARVAMRVRQGGHHIPTETICRRFAAGRRHFHEIYCQRVDFWQMFDNSGEIPIFLEVRRQPMSAVKQPLSRSRLPDADMQAAPAALARAAQRARELAVYYGTPLIISENGRVIEKIVTPSAEKPAEQE